MIDKVLVTGASGFIGANLVRRLVKDGYRVYVLLRPEFSIWRLKSVYSQLEPVVLDISRRMKVDRVIQKIQPRWIFHLATYGAYSHQEDIEEMFNTNIMGTAYLIESSLKYDVERFVYVGSSSEYGLKSSAPTENECLEPNSHYAITKAFGTLWAQYSSVTYQKQLITLRPYSVYGPFEEPTRLIPQLLINSFNKQYPPLVSKEVARDYLYIDDFIDACLLVLTKPDIPLGAIYNVGAEKQTTIEELVNLIRELFGIPDEPKWGTMLNRKWDTDIWKSDCTKIRADLNWKAKTSLEGGLQKTAQWLQDNNLLLVNHKKI